MTNESGRKAPRDMEWRKASRSTQASGNCVEVADDGRGVGVRDSKAPEIGMLTLSRSSWRNLTDAIRAGDYDI
jgi:hypothetical protein